MDIRKSGIWVTLFMGFALSACGGGGGGGGGSDLAPSPPVSAAFTIGGTVTGLGTGKTVVLQNNEGDDLTVSANGNFTFATAITEGNGYAVTILTQPSGQQCSVTDPTGAGTVTGNVTTVDVVCVDVSYTVGGTVSGLDAGKSIVLVNNGGDDLTINSNGAFTFVTALTSGTNYAVGVKTHPAGQNCEITSGGGKVVDANVTGVTVTCTNTGNTWIWRSGPNAVNDMGSYGTKGVANAGNLPTARYYATGAMDANGNGWIFGGRAFGNDLRNDLWKFDGTGWVWVSGNQTINDAGVYGTQGVASVTNVPGARENAASWIDTDGTFWLFGGEGFDALGVYGYLNDLWKFDGTNWVWVSGSYLAGAAGTYGTKGLVAASNIPGARWANTVCRDKATGDVYLFGGKGFGKANDPLTDGLLNDLWKFDGTQWTWISGPDTVNGTGVYGTKGVFADTNIPGSRLRSTCVVDANHHLMLFGGTAYGGSRGDLWKFNGTQWAWISGTNTDGFNEWSIYGTQGVASATNKPGPRTGSHAWVDASGNFWLFGGWGHDDGTGGDGWLNDLWKYDGTNWTWMKGRKVKNMPGVYGVLNTPAITNTPGARHNAVIWSDATAGTLWIFGGQGFDGVSTEGLLNDLWRYQP